MKLLLALDVGNTHTVIGCFLDGRLLHHWRISTHPLCTEDELKLKLKMILSFSGVNLEDASAIVVSSVVPNFTRVLQHTFPPEKLQIITHAWPFSFDLQIDSPNQVGADRLVNAEAAVREYGAPCIIVDSGTATTLCAVTTHHGRPQYLGGAICAGIELSMQALAKNAAQLFTVELMAPKNTIGRNTQDALQSGLLWGYASMIDGMVHRFKKELGEEDLPVICTGGISHLMKGLSEELNRFDSDLTLKGIAYLYRSLENHLVGGTPENVLGD